MEQTHKYVGTELCLFAHAINWKQYFRKHLRRYLRGDVLEVGAGMGATTRILCDASVMSWTCLEPDPDLAARLAESLAARPLGTGCEPRVVVGTTRDLPDSIRYDTILYLDVLEHIDDDAGELALASRRLRTGGCLVVLSPAHQALFSPFDRKIGHYRRYSCATLAALAPPGTTLRTMRYLDSVGLLASFANRVLLRSAMPSAAQLSFWDKVMVPCSRVLDRLFGYTLGKTILAVWQRSVADGEAH